MAIQSFGDAATEVFFITGKVDRRAGWIAIAKIVQRKLDMVHYAVVLEDLRMPPGNHLEVLKGFLKEFYSIRINSQWRIIFKWSAYGPHEVQIVDYHKG